MKKILINLTVFFVILPSFLVSGVTINKEKFTNEFKKLHSSIYKVFEYKEDTVIYNYLSYIFTDRELDEQFFNFLKEIRELEKTQSVNIIQKIEYEKINIKEIKANQIKVYVKWKVYGIVRHQLHEHDRINVYEAIYTLMYNKEEKRYKIDKTEVIKSERLDSPKRYY